MTDEELIEDPRLRILAERMMTTDTLGPAHKALDLSDFDEVMLKVLELMKNEEGFDPSGDDRLDMAIGMVLCTECIGLVQKMWVGVIEHGNNPLGKDESFLILAFSKSVEMALHGMMKRLVEQSEAMR